MKTLKKIGLGIILTALAVPNVAHAQEGLKGFFKVPYSTESGSVIPQADAFYNLPGGIS